MARAISYLRFSSPQQSLGDSERRQVELAEKYCREHGLTLAPEDVLKDLGLSAYRGTHRTEGEFAGFLAAVKAGHVPRGTVFIVEATDRLSRENPLRAFNQMSEIVLAGVKIVTLKDGIEYDEATIQREPYRLFHSLALMIAAHGESQLKGERVARAWENKRRRAAEGNHVLTPTRPAWVDLIDGKLVANKEGAATVRRIFADVASGMGCYVVAKRLQADKVPTLSGGKKSNGWNKSRILAIVQSDAPLGVLSTYKRGDDGKTRIPVVKIENYYPVIVEQSLANRARAMIAGRSFGGTGSGRKGTVLSNMFTNVAKCHECGGSMFLSHRKASRGKGGYLRCSNAVRNNGCTNNSGIQYQKLEDAIIQEISWFKSAQKNIPRHDPSHELAELIADKEGELHRLNATMSAMMDAFGANPLPAIATQMKMRAERHAAIQSEIDDLKQSLQSVSVKASEPDFVSERDKLILEATSVDPMIRYEARSRIASAIRQTVATIACMPDKTFEVLYPAISLSPPEKEYLELGEPDHVIVADTGRPKIKIDAGNVKVLGNMVLTAPPPRTVTFRTVFDSSFGARRFMDSSRPKMTFDLTNVDASQHLPGIDDPL